MTSDSGLPPLPEALERIDQQVNAKMSDYASDDVVYERLVEFNVLYGRLLAALESAYTGSARSFQVATAQMFALSRSAAAISRMPDPRGGTAGLVFEPIFSV